MDAASDGAGSVAVDAAGDVTLVSVVGVGVGVDAVVVVTLTSPPSHPARQPSKGSRTAVTV